MLIVSRFNGKSLNMKQQFDQENDSPRSKKKRKKKFSPYKKDKYAVSKIKEYENYLSNIELLSRGMNLDL